MSDYGDDDDGDDYYSNEDYGDSDPDDPDVNSNEEEFEEENNAKFLGKKTKRSEESEFHEKDDDDDEYDEEEEDEEEEDEEDEEEEDEEDEEEEQESYEFNCETGDIGEKIVYDDLKNIENKGKIEWMNKNGESFKPYDFCFTKGNKKIYIDAKSTVFEKGNAPLPVISENEEEFINNLKDNEKYIIARVFDARGENPKINYYDAKTMKKINLSQYLEFKN